MPLHASSFLAVHGLFAAPLLLTTSSVVAQDPRACECTDLGSNIFRTPDTIFHVTKDFDVAYCGHIDRSVQPYVYSGFTMWSCYPVRDSLEARGAPQGCHLYVSHSMFVVDGLALLPTGANMHLERRPCWRTEHRLFVAEDGTPKAVAGPITELIATFQEPTPEQYAQVQRRLQAAKPSVWTDEALLGQVFLCALFDKDWSVRYKGMREAYLMSGNVAALYDEFLKILHDRRK